MNVQQAGKNEHGMTTVGLITFQRTDNDSDIFTITGMKTTNSVLNWPCSNIENCGNYQN
jgi:hypothetical protein